MKESTKMMKTDQMKDSSSTRVRKGDVFITASGVVLEITDIKISGLHLSDPSVWISYDYDDNGNGGEEAVSLRNFQNNLME